MGKVSYRGRYRSRLNPFLTAYAGYRSVRTGWKKRKNPFGGPGGTKKSRLGGRNKFKGGHGFSMTRTKRKWKRRVISKGGEGTKSWSVINHRRGLRSKFALVAKQHKKYSYTITGDSLLTSSVGRQGVSVIASLHSKTQLEQLRTNLNVPVDSDMFVGPASSQMEFKNQTNIPIRFWIYDLRCRMDSATSPTFDWTQALVEQAGTPGLITDYNRKPHFVKHFTKRWHIYSTKEVLLGAGGTHKHTRIVNYNRKYGEDDVEDASTDAIKGWYNCSMIVQQGGVCDDDVNASISDSKLAVIISNKYIVYSVPDNKRFTDQANQLEQIDVQKVVLEDTDVVTTVADT